MGKANNRHRPRTTCDTTKPTLSLLQGGKGQSGIPVFETEDDSAFEQGYHAMQGEKEGEFNQVVANFSTQFQPVGPMTHTLLYQLAIVHFDIRRAENAMHRLSARWYATDPARWLKFHAGFAAQRNALLVAAQRLLMAVDRPERRDREESQVTALQSNAKYDADGNPIEEYRFWNLYKFSELPEDQINEAVEVICFTDGTARVGQSVRLSEFMNGEFMKPEYGLGAEFRRKMRAYKTPLHHPFDPSKVK